MPSTRKFWTTPSGLAFLAFLAVAAIYLYTEHRVHVIGYGPLILFLLVCVGMHFMHGGHRHGGHGGHRGHGGRRDDDGQRNHDGHRDEDERPTAPAGGHKHG